MGSTRESFGKVLRRELARSRWWLISTVLNLGFFGALSVLTALPAAERRVVIAAEVPAWMRLDDEILDELVEEIKPEIFENIEPTECEEVIEDPVIKDAKVSDHNETDHDFPYEMGLGARDFISDAPFGDIGTGASYGCGGGAGGAFGGRGGNRAAAPDLPVETWRRARLVPNTTRLMIGDKEELPLVRMNASVRVDGHRARVVLDCFYDESPGDRLEGRFMLRLPDGATPLAFAFGETHAGVAPNVPRFPGTLDEIRPEGMMLARSERGSQLRPARMAHRDRAARAYKGTVRKRVDPALVEWCGAGVFSARVYPLMRERTHHIVVAYEMDLTRTGSDDVLVLDLPDAGPDTDRSVLVDAPVAPGIQATPRPDLKIGADRTQFAWQANSVRRVTVRIPSPGMTLMTGHDDETGSYFATRFRPEIPASDAGGNSRAVFLVDTSLSSNPDRMNIWLKLLTAILSENRDSIGEFAILYFNVERFWWQERFRPNSAAEVEAALAFAQGLALEGATDLAAALEEGSAPHWTRDAGHDVFLLSDGAATWGESEMPEAKGAIFAYRTGLAGTDTRALQRVTRRTGGAVFSVVGESEIEKAARAHRLRPWRLESVSVDRGEDVLVAGNPTWVYPGQTLTLAGRGDPAANATFTVRIASGAERRELTVTPQRSTESILTPRVFGEIATAALEDLGAPAAAEAKSYAAHFRVVGKSCSLLMLEGEEDYRRYAINPSADARRVATTPVVPLADRARAEHERLRSDPRARLLADLARLRDLPGVNAVMHPYMIRAISRMDRAATRIGSERLHCRSRHRAGVAPEIGAMLSDGKPDYDAMQAAAKARRERRGPDDALRLLSSLVELAPGDPGTARDMAFTAMELGRPLAACHLFRRVASLRPAEPESWRGLATALEAAGRYDLALLYYDIAVRGSFQERTASREIAVAGYVRLLRRMVAGDVRSSLADVAKSRLADLESRAPSPGSLVVLMCWNTDRTDVDLHVTDPAGEECSYSHRETKMGGRMSPDVTGGYGPELFQITAPAGGAYRVEANYFSSDAARESLRTRLFVTIYRDYATPAESVTHRTLTLVNAKDRVAVETVVVGGAD